MAKSLGQFIRERRLELGLTQEQLAERVGEGVRQSEISRLERNRVTLPRRHRMEQIAAALDAPVGVLLARSGWAGAEVIETGTPARAPEREAPFESQALVDDGQIIEDLLRVWPTALDQAGTLGIPTADLAWPDEAGQRPDPQAPDRDRAGQHDDFPSELDVQSIRDAVTRTSALIRRTRERIDETQVILVQNRRSVERRRPTNLP